MIEPHTNKVSHQILVTSKNVAKYGISLNDGPETFFDAPPDKHTKNDDYINHNLGDKAMGTVKVKAYDANGDYLGLYDTFYVESPEYLVKSGLAQFHSGVNTTHSGGNWAPPTITCGGWGDIGWSLSIRDDVPHLAVGLLTSKKNYPANFETLEYATAETLAYWYALYGYGHQKSVFQETYLLPLTTQDVWVHGDAYTMIHPTASSGTVNSWVGAATGVCGLGVGGWMFRARLLSGNRIQVQVNNNTGGSHYYRAGELGHCNDVTDVEALSNWVGDLTPHIIHGIQCNFASGLGLGWKRRLSGDGSYMICKIVSEECSYTFSF